VGAASSLTDQLTTILIADDHVATRAGVRFVLEANGFRTVAEVGTAQDAHDAALIWRPHICLVADHLPGGAIAAVEQISAALPATKIAILTASESTSDLLNALLAGADGYVLKTVDPDRLPAILRALLDGEVAVPRSFTACLVAELRRSTWGRTISRTSRTAVLTDRELEVLALVRDGLTTAAVAEQLRISPITVRRHISKALQKLGEYDRDAAAMLIGDQALL
jgi:DNA-binding NarL/FixJ family response regulator